MLFIRHFIFFLKASLPLKISLSQTSMKSSSPRRSVQPSLKATTPPAGDPLSLPGYPFQKYLLSSLAMEASTAGKLSPFVLSPMPLPNGYPSFSTKKTPTKPLRKISHRPPWRPPKTTKPKALPPSSLKSTFLSKSNPLSSLQETLLSTETYLSCISSHRCRLLIAPPKSII